jgi:CheY-like chemotaxis protein
VSTPYKDSERWAACDETTSRATSPNAVRHAVSMIPNDAVDSIKGLRLFVVEDEALVAMLLEDLLTDLGCTVVDIVGTIRDALSRLARTVADGAVLDVNLGGEKVFPVADALVQRGMPFIFATGYGRAGLDERYPSTPVLTKPYSPEALVNVLATFRSRREN